MGNYGSGIDWNPGGTSGLVKFGNDENVLVMFYNKAVPNEAMSIQAGRRITENKIYVRIQHPGETYNIIDREVKDEDKRRFKGQWSAFLMNKAQIPEGTPIDLLFPNNPAFAENLRGMGILTIDQCAALSAAAIDAIGRGGQECVNRAKSYLENAKKGADWHAWKKKEAEWEQKFKLQQQQIADLTSKLNAYLQKATEPQYGQNPPFIPGYDAQSERINANHVTHELAQQRQRPQAPPPQSFVIDAIPSQPIISQDIAAEIGVLPPGVNANPSPAPIINVDLGFDAGNT